MNIYRRKDKQNHKETYKHADKRKNSHSVSQKLIKQTAVHSSHSQAVKQTVTHSSKLLLFDSNKQSDRTVTRSINQINKQLLISDSINLLIFPHPIQHALFYNFPVSLPSFFPYSLAHLFRHCLQYIIFNILPRPALSLPSSFPYLIFLPNSVRLILFGWIQH